MPELGWPYFRCWRSPCTAEPLRTRRADCGPRPPGALTPSASAGRRVRPGRQARSSRTVQRHRRPHRHALRAGHADPVHGLLRGAGHRRHRGALPLSARRTTACRNWARMSFRIDYGKISLSTGIAGREPGAAKHYVAAGTTRFSQEPPLSAPRDWALAKLDRPICRFGYLDVEPHYHHRTDRRPPARARSSRSPITGTGATGSSPMAAHALSPTTSTRFAGASSASISPARKT